MARLPLPAASPQASVFVTVELRTSSVDGWQPTAWATSKYVRVLPFPAPPDAEGEIPRTTRAMQCLYYISILCYALAYVLGTLSYVHRAALSVINAGENLI